MIGLAAVLATPVVVSASTVNNRNTGLIVPHVLVDFGAGLALNGFSTGTVITNQYAGSGVTFGPNYEYFLGSTSNLGPIQAGYLRNISEVVQPGAIFFTSPVSDAVFSWRTDSGLTTFKAYLDGVSVETPLIAPSNMDLGAGLGKFYGFENIVFNEIRLSRVSFFGGNFTLDNLQYKLADVSPVPLPAALPLYGSGLAIIGFIGFIGWRRRKRAVVSL